MPRHFNTIGLIGKHGDPTPHDTLELLSRFLLERGHQVLLEDATDQRLSGYQLETASLEQIGRRCDLAIIVGGDGTLLHSARNLADYKVPLLGVNLGRLDNMDIRTINELFLLTQPAHLQRLTGCEMDPATRRVR